MIKVGVIGAGHLGKIHLNILNNSDFELVGFYDTDVFNSEKLSQEKGFFFFKELHLLIEKIDAAVIVSPTTTHFEIAKECIDTLCESLSDNKHNIMVIIAGYEEELKTCFFLIMRD